MTADPGESPRFTFSSLIQDLRQLFAQLPDQRGKSNNQRYAMADAALSAFSVFFTQSPSFLDYQIRMHQLRGKNNAESIFGIHQIPSDNQIRNLLDTLPSPTLYPIMASIGEDLYRYGYLDGFRSVNRSFLIALDGTDCFSSHQISCESCSHATQKNGDTLYRHIAVTPVIVAPGQEQVIALPPEFVHPQDGHDKQDCELAAAGRWLEQWGARYADWGITVLGDDLYCHQPFCQRVLEANMNFLFTCKPDSHRSVYEWVADFTRSNLITTLVRTRRTGKKHYTDTYRFINELPLRNGEDALLVNWCELTTSNDQGKSIYHNAWATSHRIETHNVEQLVQAGRARWKIENEGNNTLKTKLRHEAVSRSCPTETKGTARVTG